MENNGTAVSYMASPNISGLDYGPLFINYYNNTVPTLSSEI